MKGQRPDAPQISIGRRIHIVPKLIKNGHLKIDAATHSVIQKHKVARRTVWSVMFVFTEGEHDPKERREVFMIYYRSEIAARCYVNRLMKKIDEARTVLQ